MEIKTYEELLKEYGRYLVPELKINHIPHYKVKNKSNDEKERLAVLISMYYNESEEKKQDAYELVKNMFSNRDLIEHMILYNYETLGQNRRISRGIESKVVGLRYVMDDFKNIVYQDMKGKGSAFSGCLGKRAQLIRN